MNKEPEEVTSGRVFLKTQHPLQAYYNGKLENCSWTRAQQTLAREEKEYGSSSCQTSSEILKSSNAMEFLCRSWSPSSSGFLQTFSSKNLLFPLDCNNILQHEDYSFEQKHVGKLETREIEWGDAPRMDNESTMKLDSRWKIKHLTEWLKEKPVTSSVRRHRVKRKEKVRLKMAKVNAALSVAQLAAAIAGFAANSSTETTNNNIWEKSMSNVIAYGAALVATVCAEAAESVGAGKSQVVSAVNSGIAMQTPADMVMLMAMAATCLRGYSALESRTMTNPIFQRNHKLLEVGARLPVSTPSGRKGQMHVTIYSKRQQLILSLEKKFLGILRREKAYNILQVKEESKETEGHWVLCLKSNNGDIKLFFNDKNQSFLWMSNISNLLLLHKSH